jgi:hypothetical protein
MKPNLGGITKTESTNRSCAMKTIRTLIVMSSVAVAWQAAAQTWTGSDVGTPFYSGSYTGSPPGVMTIVGGGDDIWNQSDNFYYFYTTVVGHSWDARVRVRDLQGPDHWTKCELMVRVPDASGLPQGPDPFIAAMTTRSAGQNQVAPQWRATRGGNADWNTFNKTIAPTYPYTWLRLTRQGSVITMWYGTNEFNWTKYADIDTASTQFGFGEAFPARVLVGVAVTAHNDFDPNRGIATISDLSVTVNTNALDLQILQNLQNRTVYSHTAVTLSFVVTNAAVANGNLGVGDYQWFKNGQPIPNATGPHYTFVVAPEDNNAQFQCRLTVGAAVLDSAVATLTVQAPSEISGYLKWEYYPGVSLASIRAGAHGAAAQVRAVAAFDSPANFADNYASRLSGWFVPPVTGNYVFFIAADDDADLYLGTNASPASKRLIAQQEGWSGRNNWQTQGGGGSPRALLQKRSDEWSPDGGTSRPYSSGIPLVAGQRYWIEAIHREGIGGDNLGVYFLTTTSAEYQSGGPADGTPSNLTNGLIRLLTWQPTTLTIVQQPQSVTQWEGLDVTFRVVVNTDSELTPTYQWQRNGVDLPGRTSPTLNFVPTMADNGARYRCVVSIPGSPLTVTSEEATLTVQQSVFVSGLVRREVWGPNRPEVTRVMVEEGTAGPPDFVEFIRQMEVPGWADNYVQRLSTWFVPPTTGKYVFYLSSDDDSDLFLSTDENEANKRLIAQQSSWNPTRAWQSGNNVSQRNSSTYMAPDGSMPGANGYQLTAGQRYYIEVVHHEAGGGDNVEVYYTLLNENAPLDGTPSNLRGNVIGLKLPAPTSLVITQQPRSVAVRAWHPAVFSVGVETDAVYPPAYQWRRNGQPIANATASVYSFVTSTNDNGAQFDCVVTVSADRSVTSQLARVTVLTDTVFVPGRLKEEFFPGAGFEAVLYGNVGAPAQVNEWTIFEAPADVGENYTRRVSGFFIPPQTGDYVFFISSDDESRLFISTNSDQPSAKVWVAHQPAWNNPRAWVSHNNPGQRRSDQFSPDGGMTFPYSMGIRLEAGRRYYIEAIHREGGGGDHLAVTYKLYNAEDPIDGSAPLLTGAVIGYMAAPAPVEPPVLTVGRQGNNVVISWSPAGGRLESSPVLGPGATWTTETTDNPAVIPITGTAKYFRVVR